MHIVQIPVLQDNYQYLVVCDKTQLAAVVDAPDASAAVSCARREGVELTAIWNTHHHWDHIGGNEELRDRFGLPVFCGAYDFAEARIPAATNAVREGDTVSVGDVVFTVIDVPGHTLGHVAYYGNGALICGDTLFGGGCGRLFEGSATQMRASLAKLAALPGDTLVYCMHEYTERNLEFAVAIEPGNAALQARLDRVKSLRQKGFSTVPSTLSEERATNPFLRWESAEIKDSLRARGFEDFATDDAVFAAVRTMKDSW